MKSRQSFLNLPRVRFAPRFVLSCLLLSALSSCQTSEATRTISLGPQQKTVLILIEPGEPLQIVSKNVVVEVMAMNGEGIGTQRIDGWFAMPPSHWREIEKLLSPPSPSSIFPPPPPVLPEET